MLAIRLINRSLNLKELFVDSEKVEYYREKLADKYNIKKDEIEFLSFEEKHTERVGYGVWWDTKEVTISDFIKFKYNDKIVTMYKGKDDFYYNELVEEVEKYYCEKLNVNNVIVEVDTSYGKGYRVSSAYASYFNENDIKYIDKNVVEDFIKSYDIDTIYIEPTTDDIEKFVKSIIDRLNQLDNFESIRIVSGLDKVITYREQPNFHYFDYYYIEGLNNIEHEYTEISTKEGIDNIYYNHYYYSTIEYNQ